MTKRRGTKRRAGPKVWIAAIAIVAALFVIGDDNPQLRRALQDLLEQAITSAPAADQIAGSARVIDGDTLDISGTRIRLFGIDAPETAQTCRRSRRDWACGKDASAALSARIGQQSLSCEERDTDRYGRVVAICRSGRENINAWMVQQGWAVAYRQYGGDIYDTEEAIARAARRGVWRGSFVMPWDWRKGER